MRARLLLPSHGPLPQRPPHLLPSGEASTLQMLPKKEGYTRADLYLI